jgi:phage gp36-like protein
MAYATSSDLNNYISAAALQSVAPGVVTAALQAASDECDSGLRAQFTLPLLPPYPQDLVRTCCQIAAADIMAQRGYSPDSGADSIFEIRAAAGRKWIALVASQKYTPSVIDSSGAGTGLTTATGPKAFSRPSRGWQNTAPVPGGGYSTGYPNGSWGCD